jgi:NADH dehydrogenase FAD-containing subunit
MGSVFSEQLSHDKHIVIIGAGYGGLKLCACLMEMKAHFTVIDSKDYFHHNVASVRTFVDEMSL